MIYQLKRISPHRAGLISGALFATFSLIFWPFILVAELTMNAAMKQGAFPPAAKWFFLALPFFYGIGSYLMTALMCILYNIYSKMLGGMQMTLELTPAVNERIES